MEKKFSVIISAYNIEKYIKRAIDSVLGQTFTNYELIVVNDASTDNTGKIISEYDNIIYVEHKENKCLGGARNTAMDIAKGEYIIFLDGDDYLNNNEVLARINDLISNQKPDIVYLGFEITGTSQDIIIPQKNSCNKMFRIAKDKYANVWSKCWNREFLEKNKLRFPEHRYYEDVMFLCKAILKSETYLVADFITHTYVKGRPNSITTNVTMKNIHDNLYNLQELIDLMQSEEKEENKEYLKQRIKRETKRCKERIDEIKILMKIIQ